MPFPDLSTVGCQNLVSSREPASAGCFEDSIALFNLDRELRSLFKLAKLLITILSYKRSINGI